jgi:hypothetical protein
MPGKSKERVRLMARAVHSQAFAERVVIPRKVAGEFNQAEKLFSPRRAGYPLSRPPPRSHVVNALKRVDSDFEKDVLPRKSCLFFIEHSLRAYPDPGMNI